ncbi:MAG: hypothetical protein ACR2KJ_11050 [Jatrophihabitans sp.]
MTMSPPDALNQLSAFRPIAETLDREWPAERRATVLSRIQSVPAVVMPSDLRAIRPRGQRRWPMAAVVAGIATVALLVGGVVAHSGGDRLPANNAAGALEQLATAARSTPVLHSGQYMHVVSRQPSLHVDDGQPSFGSPTSTVERWTAADGEGWERTSINGKVASIQIASFDGTLASPRRASLPGCLPTQARWNSICVRTSTGRTTLASRTSPLTN